MSRDTTLHEPLLPTQRAPDAPPSRPSSPNTKALLDGLAPHWRRVRTHKLRTGLLAALAVVVLYAVAGHGVDGQRGPGSEAKAFAQDASPEQRLAQLNADYDPTVEGYGVGNVDLDAYRASLHATLDELVTRGNTSLLVTDGLAPTVIDDAALRTTLDCYLSLACVPDSPIPSDLYATSRIVSPIPAALETWLATDPSLALHLLDDAAVSAFVAGRFPALARTFDELPLPILKFDLFRLLVLLARGGVYTDTDTRLLAPFSAWPARAQPYPRAATPPTRAPALVVGIEWAGRTERNARNPLYTRQAGVVQWTFGAAAGHPVLLDAARRVLRHSARVAGAPRLEGEGELQFDPEGERMVLEWSGPAVLTDAVARYLRTRHGVSLASLVDTPHPLQVGDVLVLPVSALNARAGLVAYLLRVLDWALGRGWAPWSSGWGAGLVVHEHAASWWSQRIGKEH